MALTAPSVSFATEADFFAIPEEDRFHELIDGEIIQKALPSGRHGAAQLRLGRHIGPYDRRTKDPEEPGGWRFASEVEVRLLDGVIVRPDLAGWRRERLPSFPESSPVTVRPDWICEILSRSNAVRDLWEKLSLYHRAGVPHYWVLDPVRHTLRVHRYAEPGYQVVLDVGHDAVVRAEPFERLELVVAELFDDGE
ncbi:MAG: Uma2 family endonuclease [Myxococcota bacterium]